MKTVFERIKPVHELHSRIQRELHHQALDISSSKYKLKKPPVSQEQAAYLIQRVWHLYQFKQLMQTNGYATYCDLIDYDEAHAMISHLMFGRTQAQFKTLTPDKIGNPYIAPESYYHRTDELMHTPMMKLLLEEFRPVLPPSDDSKVEYLPVSLFSNIPLDWLISQQKDKDIQLYRRDGWGLQKVLQHPLTNFGALSSSFGGKDTILLFEETLFYVDLVSQTATPIPVTDDNRAEMMSLMTKCTLEFQVADEPLRTKISHCVRLQDYTIALLSVMKQSSFKFLIRAIGVVASPWELAINQRHHSLLAGYTPPPCVLSIQTFDFDALIQRLHRISNSNRHPTKDLASCLYQLLQHPQDLSRHALHRIGLTLEMTLRFSEYHYPKFAFCCYVVLHEFSLAMMGKTDIRALEADYKAFFERSKTTLLKALDLELSDVSQHYFCAIPTMSGCNAYGLATKLAARMKTVDGFRPTVSTIGQTYYEFDVLTPVLRSDDSEIYSFSAGPIIDCTAVDPGVDINLLANEILQNPRTKKTVTFIIDATTALYHNLRLNEEVKNWIKAGKLSIIIHESHQKFKLLHSDQAQVGRMFGFLAKGSYERQDVVEFQRHSLHDFKHHLDLRIGAYISTVCEPWLENIKKRHFANGAIMRHLLVDSGLIDSVVRPHAHMLSNMDELYFLGSVISPTKVGFDSVANLLKVTKVIFEGRDSFGHFQTTRSFIISADASKPVLLRLCPDASDPIDAMLQAAEVSIAYINTPEKMLQLLLDNAHLKVEALTLSEQILHLAFLNWILRAKPPVDKIIPLYQVMHPMLLQCHLLRGRPYHHKAMEYVRELRSSIKLRKKQTFFGDGRVDFLEERPNHTKNTTMEM